MSFICTRNKSEARHPLVGFIMWRKLAVALLANFGSSVEHYATFPSKICDEAMLSRHDTQCALWSLAYTCTSYIMYIQ